MDANQVVTNQGYAGSVSSRMAGLCCDENGTVYRWTPVCYINGKNEIYQDAMYLYLAAINEGENYEYMNRHQVEWTGGTANVKEFLITDQEMVAVFINAALSGMPVNSIDESTLIEIKEGDSGDGVIELQQKLIQTGYLTGQADGSYGPAAAAAVRAFQEAEGLPPTGIADPHTKKG